MTPLYTSKRKRKHMLIIITTALLVFPLALDLVSENNPKLCERCF